MKKAIITVLSAIVVVMGAITTFGLMRAAEGGSGPETGGYAFAMIMLAILVIPVLVVTLVVLFFIAGIQSAREAIERDLNNH